MCLARAVPGQHLDRGPEVASRVAENDFVRPIGNNAVPSSTLHEHDCPQTKAVGRVYGIESGRSTGLSVERETFQSPLEQGSAGKPTA